MDIIGAGNWDIVVGVTTDGTANNALATLPPHKLGTDQCFALAFGEGVYVEDDGTRRPYQSGVTATTVDVRSSAAAKSAAFIVILLPVTCELFHYDHSAVTT